METTAGVHPIPKTNHYLQGLTRILKFKLTNTWGDENSASTNKYTTDISHYRTVLEGSKKEPLLHASSKNAGTY